MVKSTWGGDLRTFGSGSKSHEDKIRLESSKPGPGKSDLYQATGLGPGQDAPKGGSKKIGSAPEAVRKSQVRHMGTTRRLGARAGHQRCVRSCEGPPAPFE
jgi:hypothetical protein